MSLTSLKNVCLLVACNLLDVNLLFKTISENYNNYYKHIIILNALFINEHIYNIFLSIKSFIFLHPSLTAIIGLVCSVRVVFL